MVEILTAFSIGKKLVGPSQLSIPFKQKTQQGLGSVVSTYFVCFHEQEVNSTDILA